MKLHFSVLLFLAAAAGIPPVLALRKAQCAANIAQKLQNGSLLSDDLIFYRDNGVPMSNITNIELTVPGCEAQCGKQFDWYDDVGPRLTTWLVPIVLLIGNLCLATLGKPSSLFAILHLLGDPIDSFWSLLTKLEAWNRCWDLAEQLSRSGAKDKDHVRDRGTILAAIQELEGPDCDPSATYQHLINHSTLDGDDPDRPVLHHLCREIANEISDSSTNELPRTYLAILTFIFAILGAFVEAVGGKSSSQPGGRIGTAMFLSWLLPVILLSNSIGSFTSRRTLVRILERFAKATKPLVLPAAQSGGFRQRTLSRPENTLSPSRFTDAVKSGGHQIDEISLGSPAILPTGQSPGLQPTQSPVIERIQQRSISDGVRRASADHLDLQLFSRDRTSTLFRRPIGKVTSFDNAQPWFGGIYTYQTDKKLFTVPGAQKRARHPFTLFFLASTPIITATITAFLVIWYTPTVGLTCRHIPLLGIAFFWFVSAAIGRLTWGTMATGRYHWWITIVKDTIIAIPSLLAIFLSSSGIFNSCNCWGSQWSRGNQAYVQLDPDKDRKHNAETVYPALVFACVGVQAIIFLVALMVSKRGRLMMRRDEETKMDDFWKVHRGTTARPESRPEPAASRADVESYALSPTRNGESAPFLPQQRQQY